MKVRTGLVALAMLALPCQAVLAQTSAPSPQALSAALRDFGVAAVTGDDVRAIQCEVASHSAGDVECRWEQRSGDDWHVFTTWLELAGTKWTVLDAPIIVPDFDRGRLKPLTPSDGS